MTTFPLKGAEAEVFRWSREDAEAAKREALSRAGVTEGELGRQSEAASFESLRARLAWVVVSAVGRTT